MTVKVIDSRKAEGQDIVGVAFHEGKQTGYRVFLKYNPETYLVEGDVLEVSIIKSAQSYATAHVLRRLKQT